MQPLCFCLILTYCTKLVHPSLRIIICAGKHYKLRDDGKIATLIVR